MSKQRSFKNVIVASASAGAVAALAFGGVAQAQDATPADRAGDIVVTAQFRETKLQDTPIAITAVTGEMLEARSQVSIVDVAAQAPNVTINPGAQAYGGSTLNIFIRGIGQADSSFAYEPGVGMYVDDVYYSTAFGTVFRLLDLERVEVLRGPQGTLAGKNSIGGAVKLFSKKPNGDPDAFLEATIGTRNRQDFRGGANFTLIEDKLFAELSGSSERSDGYADRIDYACSHPGSGVPGLTGQSNCKIGSYGGKDVAALRAALRWLPTETLEINLSADMSDDNSELPATQLVAVNQLGRSFLSGTPFDSRFVSPNPYTSYATYAASGGTYSTPGGPVTIQNGGFSVQATNSFHDEGVAATIDWQLAQKLSLKSISSYRRYHGQFGADADESPFDFQTIWNAFQHRQVSEELRLNGSSFADAIDWTVGAYYFDSRSIIGGRIHYPGQFDTVVNDPVTVESKSAFATAKWRLTDKLNIDAGIRYTDDEKNYVFSRRDPLTGGVTASLSAINGLKSTFAGTRTDYRVGADFHLTDDIMAYASWSTGFRGGGVNPRPLFGNQNTTFEPETLDAYEVGVKADFFDRRLRLNAATFLDKYKNILIGTRTAFYNVNLPVNNNPADPLYNPTTGTFPSAVPLNAGEGDLKGAELEAFLSPTERLTIDASVSWLDFKYTKLTPQALASGVSLSSERLYTPEIKWSVGVQYEIPLGDKGSLTPRIDVSYQDEFLTTSTRTKYSVVPGYTLTNARLTWRPTNKDWEMSLSATNLFDELYYYNVSDFYSLGGVATAQPAPPREWALTVKRRF